MATPFVGRQCTINEVDVQQCAALTAAPINATIPKESEVAMPKPVKKNDVNRAWFNPEPLFLPYSLRTSCFEEAMQDIYDFFFEVNSLMRKNGLQRLDDMLRPAALSGILSDMLTARLAHHTMSLVENNYFNGHPDLIVKGVYPNDSVKAGLEGVEVKATQKTGGAVDCHSARDQNLCVFVYEVDTDTEPAVDRKPLTFTEVYLGPVVEADFRNNGRGARGTKTSTLDKNGIAKFRKYWLYKRPKA